MYAQDSIELLKQSGIDFHEIEEQGIDVQRFGELLMSSGIVLNDEVPRPPPPLPSATTTYHLPCLGAPSEAMFCLVCLPGAMGNLP